MINILSYFFEINTLKLMVLLLIYSNRGHTFVRLISEFLLGSTTRKNISNLFINVSFNRIHFSLCLRHIAMTAIVIRLCKTQFFSQLILYGITWYPKSLLTHDVIGFIDFYSLRSCKSIVYSHLSI